VGVIGAWDVLVVWCVCGFCDVIAWDVGEGVFGCGWDGGWRHD
jgi:hypothetical protein